MSEPRRDQVDDWALLQAWRAGDTIAGNKLATAYFPSVSRFFRAKLGDDVEDLIQQTFLACVEARDRINEGSNFRSYVFAVATRRLYDHLRVKYNSRELNVTHTSLADLRTTPSEQVARGQRAQTLLLALRQIPIEAQIVLELAYWEGLSGAELAEALEIEQSSARSRLTRARELLRGALRALGCEELGFDREP